TIYYDAIKTYIEGYRLTELEVGMFWLVGAALANLALGSSLLRLGGKFNSPALRGSGFHILSDVWTTVGVLGGLGLIHLTGWEVLDIVVALSVGTYLGWTGLRLVKGSIASLMDEEDLDLLEELVEILGRHTGNGIIQIHHTKVIRSAW